MQEQTYKQTLLILLPKYNNCTNLSPTLQILYLSPCLLLPVTPNIPVKYNLNYELFMHYYHHENGKDINKMKEMFRAKIIYLVVLIEFERSEDI